MKNLFIAFILVFIAINSMAQNDVIMRIYTSPPIKYGVIDTSGKITVPFVYGQILPFRNGVACASKIISSKLQQADNTTKNKVAVIEYPAYVEEWGLIDYNGNNITPFVYLQMQNCKADNRFIARNKDNKWGVINNSGETVIAFEYEQILEYTELFICKNLEKKYLIVDINGNMLNSTGYESIGYDQWFKAYRVLKNGKEGLINVEMQELIPCQFDKLGRNWSDGMLPVMQNKKWGFIDSTMAVVIPFEYRKDSYFRNGIANVETEDKQHLVIDKKNNVLSRIPFGLHGQVGDKVFITREAYIKRGDRNASFKAALVDVDLKNIIPFEYEKIYRLSDKAYLASHDDKLFGLINETGKQILPEEYEMPKWLMTVGENYIWLIQNGKFGLIDFSNKGKKILGFEYDDARHNLFSKNGKWGALDLNTLKINIPAKYDSIMNVWGWSNVYIVTQNGKSGIIDYSDNIILPLEYDNIEPLQYSLGWYQLRDKGLYGLIHNELRITLPCKYYGIQFIYDLNNYKTYITALSGKLTEIIKPTEKGFETLMTIEQSVSLVSIADNFVIVNNSGNLGVIDSKGKQIIPFEYSQVSSYSNGYFVVREAYESSNDDNNGILFKPHKRY